jgi:ADP-ribosylglycohydrolase
VEKKMLTRTELSKNKGLVFKKTYGALIGLAIGDSMGDQARSEDSHERYGITVDLEQNGSWSTDDTEFSLMVAKQLIDHKGILTDEIVVDAWLKYVVSTRNLGNKTGESEKGAALNLLRGLRPPVSGSDNSYALSDGAAMRTTPIGIVNAGHTQEAARMAQIDAQVSHYQDGIWGAQAVAASVSAAMVNATVEEIVQTGREYIPDDSWLGRAFDRAFQVVKESENNLLRAWKPLHDVLWTPYRASNPEAIPSAYAIFALTRGDFVQGIIAAANFGRDSDTLAALVGAWSGALHGIDAIPNKWIEACRFPAGRSLPFSKELDIEKIAKDLCRFIQ